MSGYMEFSFQKSTNVIILFFFLIYPTWTTKLIVHLPISPEPWKSKPKTIFKNPGIFYSNHALLSSKSSLSHTFRCVYREASTCCHPIFPISHSRWQWKFLSTGHDLWMSFPHCCPYFLFFHVLQCPFLRNKCIYLISTEFRESVVTSSKGLEPWCTEALINPNSSSMKKVYSFFRKEMTI